MSSGESIIAGEVTTAESFTLVLGARPSHSHADFNGDVILKVAPQGGDLQPQVLLIGIHAEGNSGAPSGPFTGGIGVRGVGGPDRGTGVHGLGGGANKTASEHEGLNEGGFGVQGLGGSSERQADPLFIQVDPSLWSIFPPNGPPGAGVVGEGGTMGDCLTVPA